MGDKDLSHTTTAPTVIHPRYADEETSGSKLMRKIKEDPWTPIGISGCIAMLAYNAYAWKTTKFSTQQFILRLRLKAQGMIVGMMGIGGVYMMYNEMKAIKVENAKHAKKSH